MKNAFIAYFNDGTGLLVICSCISDAFLSLDEVQVSKLVRIDSLPFPVL